VESFLNKKRLALGPWAAFERIIARFLSHGGFSDVSVVGGSGDMGADIVGVSPYGVRWIIQAKFRSQGSVGSPAVEESFRAHWAYDADVAVTVTNRTFSQEALRYRKSRVDSGFDLRLWDKSALISMGESLPDVSLLRRTPRDYQEEAIAAVMSSIRSGSEKGLVTLATGLGKTVVASSVIARYLEDNPSAKVLVLAHMSDLVRQLELASWPQFEKYIETHLWTDGEKPAYFNGVIFATWQSVKSFLVSGNDLNKVFDLVVVDECHHAPSEGFSDLIGNLEPKYVLGVTATPWRGDQESLRPLFGDPLYSMNVVEGMTRGFLAEVDYQMLLDGIDWEEIRRLSRQGLTIKDLNKTLYLPERDMALVERIVEEIEKKKDPRVLVFCRSIEHAERLQNHFRQFDTSCAVLHSGLNRTDRFLALSNFRVGRIKALISIEMLNEGIDVPEVNIVCFARVTHSRRIFLQQLGRGLRLSADKEFVTVLDFVADVRRIAAGVEINQEAQRLGVTEEVRYARGEIVKFTENSDSFFDEYLADMANISDLDDDAKLSFPS